MIKIKENNNFYLEYLLKNLFSKYLPETSIPKFLCSGVKPQDCFKEIPSNFNHNSNLPFLSVYNLIQLSNKCLNTSNLNKKIFIIHDPNDKITDYLGSQTFSKLNPNTCLVPLDGSLHNILYNSMDVVLVHVMKLFF